MVIRRQQLSSLSDFRVVSHGAKALDGFGVYYIIHKVDILYVCLVTAYF